MRVVGSARRWASFSNADTESNPFSSCIAFKCCKSSRTDSKPVATPPPFPSTPFTRAECIPPVGSSIHSDGTGETDFDTAFCGGSRNCEGTGDGDLAAEGEAPHSRGVGSADSVPVSLPNTPCFWEKPVFFSICLRRRSDESISLRCDMSLQGLASKRPLSILLAIMDIGVSPFLCGVLASVDINNSGGTDEERGGPRPSISCEPSSVYRGVDGSLGVRNCFTRSALDAEYPSGPHDRPVLAGESPTRSSNSLSAFVGSGNTSSPSSGSPWGPASPCSPSDGFGKRTELI
eukprot:ANDGO_06240.mRNA.1 hypothetical protein